jgi:hypothetical protein
MTRFFVRQGVGAFIPMVLIAAVLFGCSGAGDIVAGGGIGGTGATIASVGTVSGFGSVIVNGVAYDTAYAEVFVESISRGSGDLAVTLSLSPGMVVRVEGRFAEDGSASADSVFFSSDLRGPIESIIELDSLSQQAVILGQTILMDDRTVFRNVIPSSISPGMVLEVSGYDDDSGRIFATYVNRISDSLVPDELFEIKGEVQSVIPALQSFEMRGLTVDYSSSDLSGLSGKEPEQGQLIKVRGRLEAPNLLIAERLEVEEEFGTGMFDVVELEGIITQAPAPGEFRIGRYAVRVDEETSYTHLAPDDLNPGTRVIVHGALEDRGILAGEIVLPEKIRIESDVSSINLEEKGLDLVGLESAKIFITGTTRITGITSHIDGIQSGDHVRILARLSPGGDVLASNILVNQSNVTVELAGPVESISGPFVVVLGIEINTSLFPLDGFADVGGKPVSPIEFLETVRPGDDIAFRGLLQAGSLNWLGVTIE